MLISRCHPHKKHRTRREFCERLLEPADHGQDLECAGGGTLQDFVSAFGSKQPVQGRRQEGDLEAGESTRGRVTGRCAPFRGGAKQGAFLRRVNREARDLQAGLAFRDDGPFAEGITGLGRHCPARPVGREG